MHLKLPCFFVETDTVCQSRQVDRHHGMLPSLLREIQYGSDSKGIYFFTCVEIGNYRFNMSLSHGAYIIVPYVPPLNRKEAFRYILSVHIV